MQSHRFLMALTLLNLVLLALTLAQPHALFAEPAAQVLRGRALEIVDDAGRVRASISVLPADPNVKMPDGSAGYPETVLLRLIDSRGRPNIKIAATERGSAQVWGGDADPTYVQVLAEGPRTTLKMVNRDGKERVIAP